MMARRAHFGKSCPPTLGTFNWHTRRKQQETARQHRYRQPTAQGIVQFFLQRKVSRREAPGHLPEEESDFFRVRSVGQHLFQFSFSEFEDSKAQCAS